MEVLGVKRVPELQEIQCKLGPKVSSKMLSGQEVLVQNDL